MIFFSVLHSISFLLLCEIIMARDESVFGEEREEFGDKITTDSVLGHALADSAVSCAAECLSRKNCTSLFFVADQKRCQLHNSVVNVGSSKTTRLKSSKYYVLLYGYTYGYTYNATFNVWYRLGNLGNTSGKTWLEHRDICLSEGGDLIRIKNENMRLWIASIISKTPGGPSTRIWHIDGTDSANEGTWLDRDGNAAFVAWGSNPPNNLLFYPEGQDCLTLDRSIGYYMNDLTCHWNYYDETNYICGISF